jgi:transposase
LSDSIFKPAGDVPSPVLPIGYTVRQVKARLHVGRDKVMGWIHRGELKAVNVATARTGKPRWIITPAALEEFEKARSTVPLAPPPRWKKRSGIVDYFPD